MYSIYLEDGIEVVLVLFTAFSRGSHKRLTATSDGGMCHWMQPRQHLQTLTKVLELGQLRHCPPHTRYSTTKVMHCGYMHNNGLSLVSNLGELQS